MPEDATRKCHSALVSKTNNVRSGLTFVLFYQKYFVHYAKKGVQTKFRNELQVLVKQKSHEELIPFQSTTPTSGR